jgi:protein translocase SEC61 complex gamma subunit
LHFWSRTHSRFPTFPTEFLKIFSATSIGFITIGFIGFFVKLIHIPINNIIMGA